MHSFYLYTDMMANTLTAHLSASAPQPGDEP